MRQGLALVLLLPPAVAVANLRAPYTVTAPPGGHLGAPTASAAPAPLTVRSETLRYHCAVASCRARAVYHVTAASPLELELTFVAPAGEGITARVAGQSSPTSAAVRVPQNEGRSSWRKPLPMYDVRFAARLPQGDSDIEVEFDQATGIEEHGHSYFSKGKFTRTFHYELAPLRGWSRAPGFAIALEVAVDRAPPGWWKRTFGRPLDLRCSGLVFDARAADAAPSEPRYHWTQVTGDKAQRGAALELRTRFGDDFPDQLTCEFDGPAPEDFR